MLVYEKTILLRKPRNLLLLRWSYIVVVRVSTSCESRGKKVSDSDRQTEMTDETCTNCMASLDEGGERA